MAEHIRNNLFTFTPEHVVVVVVVVLMIISNAFINVVFNVL